MRGVMPYLVALLQLNCTIDAAACTVPANNEHYVGRAFRADESRRIQAAAWRSMQDRAANAEP